MSNVFRYNRKASDEDIIRLNSVGISLATIARMMDMHPASVTLRLKSLKITPTDTRRSFMEDVFNNLPANSQDLVAAHLAMNPGMSIRTYVSQLISKDLSELEKLLPVAEAVNDNPEPVQFQE